MAALVVDIDSGMFLAGFLFRCFTRCKCVILVWLVTMHLALCSLLASPGPDALHHGRFGPQGQYSSCSSSTIAVACARLVLLVILHHALYFFPSCRQAPDARHPGRYGPDGQLRGEILADMVVDISFMAQRQIPTVLSDHRVSPVACGYGGRCRSLQVVQILRCCL